MHNNFVAKFMCCEIFFKISLVVWMLELKVCKKLNCLCFSIKKHVNGTFLKNYLYTKS